ncbi:MAG: hypothetical protein ACJ714_16115 [Ornithinibacter sp.]
MTGRALVATLVALALAAVTTVGLVGMLRAQPGTVSQDQCALPLSERVGGWICPGERPAP